MGKVSAKRRQFTIKKKKKTKRKIQRLKEKYSSFHTKDEKEKTLEKIKKISPYYPVKRLLKENE